jgi:hypothetical protein
MGCMIVEVKSGDCIADSTLSFGREVNTGQVLLGPGKYMVVPYTSGGQLKAQSGTSRPFVVSLHADQSTVELAPVASSAAVFGEALEDLILEDGTQKPIDGNCNVHSFTSGPVFVFGLSCNKDAQVQKVAITMDFSSSQNVQTNQASLKQTYNLTPGDFVVTQMLCPSNRKLRYSASYGMSWRTFR